MCNLPSADHRCRGQAPGRVPAAAGQHIKVFGHGMPDGQLAAAAGQLVKVKHSGCYHAARKREQRAAN